MCFVTCRESLIAFQPRDSLGQLMKRKSFFLDLVSSPDTTTYKEVHVPYHTLTFLGRALRLSRRGIFNASTGYPTQSVSCLHRLHRMHVNAVMRFNDFRQPMSGSHGLAL